VVVDEIFEVVKVGPVAKLGPPVGAAYQLIVPAEAVAPKLTVPGPHRDPVVVFVIVGTVLTVATTAVLVPVVQPFDVAST
jgi:hypothetical protein